MTQCTRRMFGEPDGMRCVLEAHGDLGHEFHASVGSDLAAEASTGDDG